MGDRANIVMHEAAGRIFFYTHWAGYNLPAIAQAALARGTGRWEDPPYLARIVFSEMIQGNVLDETGYGISLGVCDNDGYPLLVIDVDSKQVRFEAHNRCSSSYQEALGKAYTFEEYCALKFDDRDAWRVVAGVPDEEE